MMDRFKTNYQNLYSGRGIPRLNSPFLKPGANITHNATLPLSDITGGSQFIRLRAASSVATKDGYMSQGL